MKEEKLTLRLTELKETLEPNNEETFSLVIESLSSVFDYFSTQDLSSYNDIHV